MKITLLDVDYLSFGAAFLGSGGGGNFRMNQIYGKLIKEKLKEVGTFKIHDLSFVEPDSLYCVTSGVGSPEAGTADVIHYKYLQQSIELICGHDENIKGILSIESGTNMLITLYAAISGGYQLINCDGAGRSAPHGNLLTYAHQKELQISPVSLVDATPPDKLQATNLEQPIRLGSVLYGKNFDEIESLFRGILSQPLFGELATMSLWKMKGNVLNFPNTVVPNTYTKAIEIGKILYDYNQKTKKLKKDTGIENLFSEIKDHENDEAFLLAFGTVEYAGDESKSALEIGKITIREENGNLKTLVFQNETLLVWDEQKACPIAMAPDLICQIKPNGIPYANVDVVRDYEKQKKQDLKTPIEIVVIGIQASQQIRNMKGLMACYLKTLNSVGFFGKYKPVEDLLIEATPAL